MPDDAALTFLLPMAATKGLYALPFLRQAHALGVRLLVVTGADAQHLEWPRELLAGLYVVPDLFDAAELRNAVSYLARSERIDRIVGLGEYDVEIAAGLREHMRLPGMGISNAMLFRDKLAMRVRAQELGLPVPEFSGIFHHPSLHAFTQRTPGPWVLKPRMEASSIGIRKLHDPEAVWATVKELGDRQSHHLLERFIPGEVYHVDSLVDRGEIRFAQAHRYGTPILELHTTGGVYTTCALERGSVDEEALQDLNRRVIAGLGLEWGATHIEYIRGAADARFYFLEASARVGSGMIEELVELSRGLNLWREWARIEVAQAAGSYELPELRPDYGGVAIRMLNHERPNLDWLGGEEGIHPVVPKPYHAAVLVRDPDSLRAAHRLAIKAQELGRIGQSAGA